MMQFTFMNTPEVQEQLPEGQRQCQCPLHRVGIYCNYCLCGTYDSQILREAICMLYYLLIPRHPSGASTIVMMMMIIDEEMETQRALVRFHG